jgi:UDP-3-O-[3-hydroxymyristoyl] glucosamine N-acyltransferase LpxD
MKLSINEILDFIGNYELIGPRTDLLFDSFKSLKDAENDSITWIKPKFKNNPNILASTRASLIIAPKDLTITTGIENKSLILVDNPKLIFSRLITHFYISDKPNAKYIDPSTIVHPNAQIRGNSVIDAYCVIGKAVIGENAQIGPFCRIEDNVVIGKNVRIKPHTVIGKEGFSFEKDENGKHERFPQIGGVVIGDNVEIGSHVSVDRGTLGNTKIGNGVKIDDFCYIAHNIEIGENTIIIGKTNIGGSTTIGKDCYISSGVNILNGITIEDSAFVGIGSVVILKVKKGKKVFGNPAQVID